MDSKQVQALVHRSVPALGRLGVQVVAVGPGSVTLVMPFEGNSNHVGTMYAGALFAIAELPAGILPETVPGPAGVVPIAESAEVRFLRPARSDVTVHVAVDPELLRSLLQTAAERGRADLELRVSVRDAHGTEVATAVTRTLLRRAGVP